MPSNHICCGDGCTTRIYQKDRHKYRPYPGSEDYLCSNCYRSGKPQQISPHVRPVLQPVNHQSNGYATRLKQSSTAPAVSIIPSTPVPPHLLLLTVPTSRSECCVCQNPLGQEKIPKAILTQVWRECNLIIPRMNKMCSTHFDPVSKLIDSQSLDQLRNRGKVDQVLQDDVMSVFNEITEESRKPSMSPKYHFENDLYSDVDCKTLTGLSKVHFEDLADNCKDLKGFKSIGYRTRVGAFMAFLRLGISQEAIGSLFGISQTYISRTIQGTVALLQKKFVPKHIGYSDSHMTRQDFITKHTSNMAEGLCDDAQPNSAICIADATYLYIQKSSNFALQKKTYSVQKGRWLVKPMMIVSTTGYILEVEGLYMADGGNNDATIFNSMLMDSEGFQSFFQEGDACILDRGFRDSIDFAKSYGYLVKTPHFLPRGQKQLTTEAANESRIVTKMRWVVESANARLKKFNFFKNTIQNTHLPNLGKYTRTACAILNAYSPPILTNKTEYQTIVQTMLTRRGMANLLKDAILLNGIDKQRVIWNPIDGLDLDDFPILSLEDLHEITLGIYQVRLAASYSAHHMSEGEYTLSFHRDNNQRLRVKLKSRHTGGSYQLWLDYRPYDNGPNSILGWYCQCKVGARIVGVCAHVSSVLWFLGHARHQESIPIPAERIGENLLDAANMEFDVCPPP